MSSTYELDLIFDKIVLFDTELETVQIRFLRVVNLQTSK
jgi:hypothetical protein